MTRTRGPGTLFPVLAALLFLLLAPSADAAVRQYWIAAVPATWNVVPNGRNAIEHEVFSPAETVFRTAVYKRYTRNWGKPMRDLASRAGDNDGIPGPLIRARVGDTILVHFLNLDTELDRPRSTRAWRASGRGRARRRPSYAPHGGGR